MLNQSQRSSTFIVQAIIGLTLIYSHSFLNGQTLEKNRTIPESAKDVVPLAVGESIPTTPLFDAEGNLFDLGIAATHQPTILMFYRGGWCPFCNMQMGHLIEIEDELLEMGYQIIAISPDTPTKMRATNEKWSMKYTLLSDSEMKAAVAFGVAYHVDEKTISRYKGTEKDLDMNSGQDHHLLPVPATFVVGTDGKILFAFHNPNYKIRIESDELLKVAEKFAMSAE